MPRRLALLRAVNVGGRKVPMAELRALASDIGLGDPATFIASGNLLFDADEPAEHLEARLEAALTARFGMDVPTLVRGTAEWSMLLAANPFADVAAIRPNLVMVGVPKRSVQPDAADRIRERAAPGERVAIAGGGLWFDYGEGVAASRITPALIDRAAGCSITTRNWTSALKLGALLGCPQAAV